MSKPQTPEQKARRAEYLKAWRAANPDKTRDQQRRYRALHPERIVEVNRRTRTRLGPEYWRDWKQTQKALVIARYGGRCACCGETERAFLSIDHVNGGGHQERLRIGANGVTRRLLAAAFPIPGYRVLCMNCQFGTMHGQTCPHQRHA